MAENQRASASGAHAGDPSENDVGTPARHARTVAPGVQVQTHPRAANLS